MVGDDEMKDDSQGATAAGQTECTEGWVEVAPLRSRSLMKGVVSPRSCQRT